MRDFPKLNISKTFICAGCGECCNALFGKRFGAAITTAEKTRLETLAARRTVQVHFYPLTKNYAGNITTWQFADNKCPFFDPSAKGKCKIYPWRPLLCRAFPLMPYGVGDCGGLDVETRLYKVCYTPEQIAAGTEYVRVVASLIKGAAQIYDINKNKWRINQK